MTRNSIYNTIEVNNTAIWLSSKKVFEIYSIRRQTLYRLLRAKKIISKCNKSLGAKKGARYWNRESIDMYFESLGDGIDTFKKSDYIYTEKASFPTLIYKPIQKYDVSA